jgi:hypothetical protein
MLHSKPTSAFLLHTTGLKCIQTFLIIRKLVSDANKKNPHKNLHYYNLFLPRTSQTSGYTHIFFGPMLAAGHQHKYILCITDTFTNYVLVTAMENKEVERVAKAIFSEWFCKFGIPAQIYTDGGKEFVNKLSSELFTLLNIQHTKTTPAHPQCNAQVEVFNKTVRKYLASFVDDTTLDWENFLLALMLSYNTSYHSTIATTPFELLFGEKPRLPSFPNPDIQRLHYGKSTSAERYQLLQKIHFLAKNISSDQGDKIKDNFEKNAVPHSFKIHDLVWYEDFSPLGKNPKLTPKWQGPAKITEINDTNAHVLLPNRKTKILNVMHIKKKKFRHHLKVKQFLKTMNKISKVNQKLRPLLQGQ